jgi:type 1 glutamine amidotransferase
MDDPMQFSRRLQIACLAILLTSSIGVAQADTPAKKKLLLLAQAPDGHPPQTHEYIPGLERLEKLLAQVPELDVEFVRADEPWSDGPEKLEKANGAVLFLAEGGKWIQSDPRRLDAFARLAARGGGLSALHWGTGAKRVRDIQAYVNLLGGCHGGPDRRYKFLETDVRPAEPAHAIAAGIRPFHVRDEFYYELKFAKTGTLHPVLEALIDDKQYTVSWAWERPDGGRSFGFTGLHFDDNWKRAAYRRLITQGVLWTMKLDDFSKLNFD